MQRLFWVPLLAALTACAPAVQGPVRALPPARAAVCYADQQPVSAIAVQAVLDGDLGSAVSRWLLDELPDMGLTVVSSADFPQAQAATVVVSGGIDQWTTPDDRPIFPLRVGSATLHWTDQVTGEQNSLAPERLLGEAHPMVAEYLPAVKNAVQARFCPSR